MTIPSACFCRSSARRRVASDVTPCIEPVSRRSECGSKLALKLDDVARPESLKARLELAERAHARIAEVG